MTQTGLTAHELQALGIWCAYKSARHGQNQCFAGDYQQMLDGEQIERVRIAEDVAVESLTRTLEFMFGGGWLDAIARIEAKALSRDH